MTSCEHLDDRVAERVTRGGLISLSRGVARVNDAVAAGKGLGAITKLVEQDPNLALNVARLARSAAYTGDVGAPVSLPYAVMRLGAGGVRAVCLTLGLAEVSKAPGPLSTVRQRVWRECLAAALTCQAMAPYHKLSGDDAYLLGLVHDFGKIVAVAAVEAEGVGAGDVSSLMERHHCDAGWVMTDAWGLPAEISAVTARHHAPASESALHDVVVEADRVVAVASARGWQIAAQDIARVAGVSSQDEAYAVRIALAKHPYFWSSIG